MLRSNPTYKTSEDAKETKPTTRQKTPSMVRIEALQKTGMLLPDFQIAILKELNLPKGRYHRREINALLEKHHITGWTCPYSIIRGNGMAGERDALYAIYRDAIDDKPSIIGSGLTSKVKDVQNLDTGAWSVLKVLSNYDKIAEHEHGMLKKLGRADSYLIEKDSKNGIHKREIVMERANGVELYKLIHDKQLPTDSMLLKKIALNILIQLKALHDKGILIRDLKHENIIVDPETGDATIIDFGFAIEATNGKASDHKRCGTAQYIAPEIYFYPDNHTYTIATDIYAAGVVLRGLLTGSILKYSREEHLFYDKNDGIKRIVKYKGTEWESPYVIEEELQTLYRRMRHEDSRLRPDLAEACDILKRHISEERQTKAVKSSPSAQGMFSDSLSSDKERVSDERFDDDDSAEQYLNVKSLTMDRF